jgi:hypothetical protein
MNDERFLIDGTRTICKRRSSANQAFTAYLSVFAEWIDRFRKGMRMNGGYGESKKKKLAHIPYSQSTNSNHQNPVSFKKKELIFFLVHIIRAQMKKFAFFPHIFNFKLTT